MRKKAIQRAQQSPSAASRVYSRENVGRYAERARQRRRGKAIRRGVLFGFLGVLLVAVVAAGAWVQSVMSRLNNGDVITNDLLVTLVDSDVTRDPFYMLLLGTDGRPGEENYRSDTIILARIDPTKKQVTLISIPRDTKVEYNGQTMKINGVHTYAGAVGMVQAVNELCGVEISHYAEISFDGMVALVNALGGVEVNVPDKIDDPKAGDFVIEPGLQTLNGDQALAFCRSRAFPDGDYTRMRHQRIFLAALANTILNDIDASNIVSIINSVSDMVVTDLDIQDIVSLANAMRGMDTSAIYTANLPSWAGADTMIDGQSYVFVYEDQLKEMMARVDAGEDPEGPQTMGETGESATVKDLTNNDASSWSDGTATTGSSSDSSNSDEGE